MSAPRERYSLYALAVAAFAIGMAEFIVVGILPSIASEFSVSLDSAGSLVSFYAFALALATPIVTLATRSLPRKALLIALMALFTLGNLIAAVAGSWMLLLAARVMTAVAHGVFFAVGATVAARLVPAQDAGRAIATMFAGLTLAMVVGVPAGSWLGALHGWRLPFFAIAALAGLGLAALALVLPGKLVSTSAGRWRDQVRAAAHPALLLSMLITALGFGASFIAFTYITPLLTELSGFSVSGAALALMVFGLATFLGNHAGGALAARCGADGALIRILLPLAAVLAALPFLLTWQPTAIAAVFVWGLLAFGMSPALQARMLEIACRFAPQAGDLASGLNISAFNLGIAAGAWIGGQQVGAGHLFETPFTAAAFAVIASMAVMLGARCWSAKQAMPV